MKEKRKQKLMKAGFDARARARREKELEKEEKLAEEQRETDEREGDPEAWVQKMRLEHSVSDLLFDRKYLHGHYWLLTFLKHRQQ